MHQRIVSLITLSMLVALVAFALPLPASAKHGGVGAQTFYISEDDFVHGGSCSDPDVNYDPVNGLEDSLLAIYDDVDFSDGDTIVLCDNGAGVDYIIKEDMESQDIANIEVMIIGEEGQEVVIDADLFTPFYFVNGTLFIENLSIQDSNLAIRMTGDAVLNVTNVQFEDGPDVNTATGQGINVVGDVTVANSTFSFATHGGDGGAIRVTGTLSVTDSTFTNNSVSGPDHEGGAIYAGGEVTISGSTFTDNSTAVAAGGAVFGETSVSIEESEFIDNTSAHWAGAVSVGADLQVSDSLFDGNKSTSVGAGEAGAIRAVGSGATVNIQDSTFRDNEATTLGGALVMQNLAVLEIEDTRFESNEAVRAFGGAMNMYSVQRASISGSEFVGNAANGDNVGGNGNGGAIDACNISDFTVHNSLFDSNVSTDLGGAIGLFGETCNDTGTVEITFSEFRNNEARLNGGALWLDGELTLLRGNLFESNSAGGSGGALFSGSSFDDFIPLSIGRMQSNKFYGNHADGSGGAIFLVSGIDAMRQNRFRSNTSDTYGGAIHAEGFTRADWRVVRRNQFYSNAAGERGGAIYNTCSSFTRSDQRRIESRNRLRRNQADGDRARQYADFYEGTIC